MLKRKAEVFINKLRRGKVIDLRLKKGFNKYPYAFRVVDERGKLILSETYTKPLSKKDLKGAFVDPRDKGTDFYRDSQGYIVVKRYNKGSKYIEYEKAWTRPTKVLVKKYEITDPHRNIEYVFCRTYDFKSKTLEVTKTKKIVF